ncbi:MAG: aspartate-semialdehyde dehydrogenase, partial [Bacteroidota bacterium]
MKLALIGATGLVGREILRVLEVRPNLPAHSLIPVASPDSLNTTIQYQDTVYEILSVEHALKVKPDVVIFAAGADDSQQWAPHFTELGATVIDNSTAWRMHPDHRLIIPEVN